MENAIGEKIIIRRYNYLKYPVYKWAVVNTLGGSFSTSGEYRSLKKCVLYARNVRSNLQIEVYNIMEDGEERFNLMLTEKTDGY
jgi:hypothetical protein